MHWEGKTVWITGASSGIGRALALRIAARGATVLASARNEEALESLAAEAGNLAGIIEIWPLDVGVPDQVANAAAGMLDLHGRIDIAILNAGTYFPTPAAGLDASELETLMRVNYFGVVNALEVLIPAMRRAGAGTIGVVASVAGYRGLPSAGGYSASKAALIALCESLAPELAGQGIRLKLVNPGFVRTPLTEKNDFRMPFLMEADAAARRLMDGLGARRFETTFPRRFTWLMKLLRLLPNAAYFFLARRLLKDA